MVKNLPVMQDRGLIPGSGRPTRVREWLPTLVFLPENSTGRGAWWATVHGVTKSWTQLSDLACSIYGLLLSWRTQIVNEYWYSWFAMLCEFQLYSVSRIFQITAHWSGDACSLGLKHTSPIRTACFPGNWGQKGGTEPRNHQLDIMVHQSPASWVTASGTEDQSASAFPLDISAVIHGVHCKFKVSLFNY